MTETKTFDPTSDTAGVIADAISDIDEVVNALTARLGELNTERTNEPSTRYDERLSAEIDALTEMLNLLPTEAKLDEIHSKLGL